MRQFTVLKVRLFILAVGLALSIGQTALAWQRGAAPSEVFAPLLYMPIFLGAIFAFLPGALIAAAFSSVLYYLVIIDVAEVIGTRLVFGLMASRVATYFFYAIVVAYATRSLEDRMIKLAIYDDIDDETGLYNPSYFVHTLDSEMRRSRRYNSDLSVVELRLDAAMFDKMRPRPRKRLLKKMCCSMERVIRNVDKIAIFHGPSPTLLFILPATGPEGAAVFASRLVPALDAFFPNVGDTVAYHYSFPENAESLIGLRDKANEIIHSTQPLALKR